MIFSTKASKNNCLFEKYAVTALCTCTAVYGSTNDFDKMNILLYKMIV